MKSQLIRRSSSVSQLSRNIFVQISFKFQLLPPLGHNYDDTFFLIFEKINVFYNFSDFFFLFSITWDPMGAKILKSLLLPQITFAFFQLFLNFLLSGPHKSTV